MKYHFINRPVPLPVLDYTDAITYLRGKFEKTDGFRSLYRFGNITTPGISDLDILVVFEDNCKCLLNGFEDMPARFRNVFTHGIMAMSESHFHANNHFTLWSKYELVGGAALIINQEPRDAAAENALRIQTAVEFITANYLDLKIQQSYKVFKLRSLLQHMKGIAYDLEYLGIDQSPLYEPLARLKSWIRNWFEATPSDKVVNNWILEWIPLFDEFMQRIMPRDDWKL